MDALKLTEKDYRNCELYLKTKNEDLLVDLYKKIGSQLCNIMYSKITRKLYAIPLEKQDLLHIVWKSIKYSVEKLYKDESKQHFMGFLINTCYQATLREVRKFLTNGERVMNDIISYDECVEKNKYFDADTDNIVYMQKSYSEAYKEINDFIISRLSKLNKRDVKKVVYLKSLGYKNVEIEKKLNFPHSYVRRIICVIKKIGEKY